MSANVMTLATRLVGNHDTLRDETGHNLFSLDDLAEGLAQLTFLGQGVFNVMDPTYGATTVRTDNQTPINAAIAAASAAGGGIVLIPAFLHTSETVTILNRVQLVGLGVMASGIIYSGVGDGIALLNPINSSGYGATCIRDLTVSCTNVANVAGGVDLVGYAYHTVRHVRTAGFKYGLILDQVEVVQVEDCLFDSPGTTDTNTANVWIVNGPEHTPTAATNFTNVISISGCQFNGGKVGLLDDGGDAHYVRNNNFNANSVPVRLAGANVPVVVGNVFETALATGNANVLLDDMGGVDGTKNKGPCTGGVIEGNNFAGDMVASHAMLSATTSSSSIYHTGLIVVGNTFNNQLGRAGAINCTKLSGCRLGPNQDPSPDFHYVGVHNDAHANELAPAPANCAGTLNGVAGRPGLAQFLLGGVQIGDQAVSTPMQIDAVREGQVFIGGFTLGAGAWGDLGTCTVTGAVVGAGDIALSPSPNVDMKGILSFATVTAADTVHGWAFNPTASGQTLSSGTWTFGLIKRT